MMQKTLVVGATGVVGSIIANILADTGEMPLALSRKSKSDAAIDWYQGDLAQIQDLNLPPFETLICTADARHLAPAMPCIIHPRLRRVVFITSTSIITKINSEVESERESVRAWASAEHQIIRTCEESSIEWTCLRPTLIYAEGRDGNITPLARLIERFGFMPVVGAAQGLRQPVHAEDVAIAAVSAARERIAANKTYILSGSEVITYREMVGRIFDALSKRRRIVSVPAPVWKLLFAIAKPLFPGANSAWGTRMLVDLDFDASTAVRELGWRPRGFHPVFKNGPKTPGPGQ
ncbi:SDR family oxidoreductase [Bradyrhizobium sp. USDA 241]|uniref:SDR family oxidoreductase n=1 Tax=Bradyrhizobium sp. USDA 241 TaxID=3377725 RepID=UPI003C72AEBD